MMLCKLSVKNIIKSFRNYMIYFATIILGVAIFYVFNAIEKQSVMLNVMGNGHELIMVIGKVLSVVSVFVAVVFGFLIVYASTFLLKKRKKEFGIYMTLGMSKKKISTIITIETIIIGFISLFAGLLIGVCASQAMSVLIANIFEADMTSFQFVISENAIVKTIIYFLIMYAVVIVFQALIISRSKLISLLNASKKSEKRTNKNPYVCAVVFVISLLILGSAYYNVTAGFTKISTIKGLGVEVTKGIVGNFMLFWSLSGLLLLVAKVLKGSYYRGINSFTINELSSRINSTVISAGVIALLMFFTICILSCSFTVKRSIDLGLKRGVQRDIQFQKGTVLRENAEYISVPDYLKKDKIDTSKLKDVFEVTAYASLKDREAYELYVDRYINQSEYNKLAREFGFDEVELADDEYLASCEFSYYKNIYDSYLRKNTTIKIGDVLYKPAKSKSISSYITMEAGEENMGILIFPDSCDLEKYAYVKESNLYANYKADSKNERARLDAYYSDENLDAAVYTKNEIYEASRGTTVMIVFVGLYFGLVFMMASAAILALKILSDAADNKDKYVILRKIGTDNKMITASIAKQCGIYFGLPLLVAIVHSIFGIQTGTNILSFFGKRGMTYSIIVTAMIIVAIYGGYAILTFVCSKRIIDEAN